MGYYIVIDPDAPAPVQFAIPFTELCGFPPAEGTVWGANWGRSPFLPEWEVSSWTATRDWHAVEHYGRLVL